MNIFVRLMLAPLALLVLLGVGIQYGLIARTGDQAQRQRADGSGTADTVADSARSQFPNLTALGIDGSEFWVTRPATFTFKEPFQQPSTLNPQPSTVWIRRLIPSDLSQIQPLTPALRALLVKDQQPHRLALVSILENNPALMATARNRYLSLGKTMFENRETGPNKLLTAMAYGLDLIQWESEAQFEQAFALIPRWLNAPPKTYSTGGIFYDNDYWGTNGQIWRCVVAATCQGRPGPSGTWADDALGDMHKTPVNTIASLSDYTPDPYMACNILSLIGIEGNEGFGREAGGGEGLGLYTRYYVCAFPVIYGWSNATGEDLFGKCYFFKSILPDQVYNERTALRTAHDALCAKLLSASPSPQAAWLWARHPAYATNDYWAFMHALWNRGTAPQPPTEKLVEADGAVCYTADPADPNSFWCQIPVQRLRPGRFAWVREGISYCGIGKVGLIGDIQFKATTTQALGNCWSSGGDLTPFSPYWSNQRPKNPTEVATIPIFVKRTLAQQPLPKLDADGHLRMTLDYSDNYVDKTVVKKAVTSWDLDPATKTLVIEHTVQVPNQAAVFGYYFSPRHASVVTPQSTPATSRFTTSDGVNSITVTLEPLDGTTLTRVIAPATNWSSAGRVAENVGYTVSPRLPEHKARISIKCQ